MRSQVVGMILAMGIVYFAIAQTADASVQYFNLLSVIIVFGGSLSVAIITYGLKNSFSIFMLFFKAFSTGEYNNVRAVEELVDIAKRIHFGEATADEIAKEGVHPFVADGLGLIYNKFDQGKLRKILLTMLKERQRYHDRTIEQLDILAKYPPAFGMMGTIIGLVAVLNQINDPDNIAQIGPSMAVALITTLYGIFLANYVIQPISDNLLARSQSDIKIRQIIAEGILLISDNEDPIFVREVLLGHLMPEDRMKYKKSNTQSGPSFNEEIAA